MKAGQEDIETTNTVKVCTILLVISDKSGWNGQSTIRGTALKSAPTVEVVLRRDFMETLMKHSRLQAQTLIQ